MKKTAVPHVVEWKTLGRMRKVELEDERMVAGTDMTEGVTAHACTQGLGLGCCLNSLPCPCLCSNLLPVGACALCLARSFLCALT